MIGTGTLFGPDGSFPPGTKVRFNGKHDIIEKTIAPNDVEVIPAVTACNGEVVGYGGVKGNRIVKSEFSAYWEVSIGGLERLAGE